MRGGLRGCAIDHLERLPEPPFCITTGRFQRRLRAVPKRVLKHPLSQPPKPLPSPGPEPPLPKPQRQPPSPPKYRLAKPCDPRRCCRPQTRPRSPRHSPATTPIERVLALTPRTKIGNLAAKSIAPWIRAVDKGKNIRIGPLHLNKKPERKPDVDVDLCQVDATPACTPSWAAICPPPPRPNHGLADPWGAASSPASLAPVRVAFAQLRNRHIRSEHLHCFVGCVPAF